MNMQMAMSYFFSVFSTLIKFLVSLNQTMFLKKTKRFAYKPVTSLFPIRSLLYAHQIERLVLTILTNIITFSSVSQCKS